MDPSTHRDTLRMVFGLLWSETDRFAKRQLTVSFSLVIVSSALAAMTPIIYKTLIDGFTGVAPPNSYLTPVVLICVYVIAQYTIRSTGELRGLFHGQGIQRLTRRLSYKLFGHIIRLPLQYHLDRKTGAVGETLGQGLAGCQIILQHFVFTLLPIAIEFLAIVAVLIHFGHATYLAIFGFAAIAYIIAFYHAAVSVTEPAKALSNSHIEMHSVLTDSLLNYETVKFFNGERAICGHYEGALVGREVANREFLVLRTRNGLLVATIFAISMGASLGYAGYEVLHHTMTVGDFVLINSYVIRLVQPLETIGFAVRDISQGLAFLQKMLEMFQEKPEDDPKAGHVQAGYATRGELTFERIIFSYKAGRTILNDVSFCIPAGKTVAIVGVSGSGKSSLIRLLFRLYEPDGGRILLDGISINKIPLANLRSAIAVVPQDTMLFNDTIGKNIGFGRVGASQADIEHAAKLAHLDTFIKNLSEGYDTKVGERGLKLSGGEKQRIAIARAALKNPRIFVFDEATSSLDSRTEQEILRNLMEVAKTTTTLIVAHRLSTVTHADEIIVLHNGVIVERGAHAVLLERNGSYAALWRAQQNTRGTNPQLAIASP